MKKFLFFIIIIFYSVILRAQKVSKIDTNFLKTDDYSNFKTYKQVYPINGTVALDSLGNWSMKKNDKAEIITLDYFNLTNKANSLFKKQEYSKAVDLYILAFKNNNDQGQVRHRYNAACCYAKANKADSVFLQLYRIAEKGNYYNYKEIETEKCFSLLHSDNRWTILIKIIKSNAVKIEKELNSTIPENE